LVNYKLLPSELVFAPNLDLSGRMPRFRLNALGFHPSRLV
jgi:hypothetical protein